MAQVVDLQELASLYRTWDTSDLVRASEVEAGTYSPEALALLQRELASRGQKPAELEAAVSRTLAEDRERYRGVKGFLALMLVDIATRSLFDLAGLVLLLTGRPSRILSLFALVAAPLAAVPPALEKSEPPPEPPPDLAAFD